VLAPPSFNFLFTTVVYERYDARSSIRRSCVSMCWWCVGCVGVSEWEVPLTTACGQTIEPIYDPGVSLSLTSVRTHTHPTATPPRPQNPIHSWNVCLQKQIRSVLAAVAIYSSLCYIITHVSMKWLCTCAAVSRSSTRSIVCCWNVMCLVILLGVQSCSLCAC